MMTLSNAIVLSVDAKPSIQTLERAQDYFKLPDAQARIGQSYDYRAGTARAPWSPPWCQVMGRHYKRRRRVEFPDFMNHVVAASRARARRSGVIRAG
jgi:hypothetical protein